MAAYLKSALWLVGFSSVGYILLVATTPNEEYLAKVSKTLPGVEKSSVETVKKKQQFIDVLQAVTETKEPLHRLSKAEIEELSRTK